MSIHIDSDESVRDVSMLELKLACSVSMACGQSIEMKPIVPERPGCDGVAGHHATLSTSCRWTSRLESCFKSAAYDPHPLAREPAFLSSLGEWWVGGETLAPEAQTGNLSTAPLPDEQCHSP